MTWSPRSPRSTLIGSFTLLALALAAPARAESLFVYNDFSNTDGLSLNADATVVANQLQLTHGLYSSRGSAFTTQQVELGVDATFSTRFTFQMTNPGGANDGDGQGADGIAFVIQTVSNNVGKAKGTFWNATNLGRKSKIVSKLPACWPPGGRRRTSADFAD